MAEVSASTSAVALTFQFPAFQLRTVMRDGEPWFVAADVCEALTIANVSLAVNGRPDREGSGLDDDERGIANVNTPYGEQQMLIVNESGLYSLILTSRKPEAKKFKKWVTSEVLPAIRKTGRYEQVASAAWLELDGVNERLEAAQAQVQALQTRLIKSQASQLRLMGCVIGLQKRWGTREAHDTIIRMERQGASRPAIIAASGYTSNHVRQIIFRARSAGELPARSAAPTAQAALFEGV